MSGLEQPGGVIYLSTPVTMQRQSTSVTATLQAGRSVISVFVATRAACAEIIGKHVSTLSKIRRRKPSISVVRTRRDQADSVAPPLTMTRMPVYFLAADLFIS